MAPQCQALHLSDETRCTEAATNVNGLFCHFHSRQAYGLYKGYKRRNAALDHLSAHPPPFLAAQEAASTPLTRVDFSPIDGEDELRALHDHLFERHALLDRVIRARKLHHSRFYALNLDYGHQHYLDALQSQKHAVLRALERVERRTAEVLYEKQKWFKWVRQLEDEEELQRDQEKKKVKQEAQLLKRHWKEVEARLRELRKREEQRREDEFLNKALEERARMDEDDGSDEDWDPIEDSVEDERGNYIDLLRLFLWQEAARDVSKAEGNGEAKVDGADRAPLNNIENAPAPSNGTAEKAADAPKSKAAKKRARQKAAKANDPQPEAPKPGEVHVENRDDVRQRLREGQKLERGPGWKLRGTVENPTAIEDRMPPVPDDEIDVLLSQITEIKQLLFCRLVLGHAALLPVALRSNSIEEFLADDEVTNIDLRDLCLEMEQPGLQQLRDACADLDRGEEEEDGEESDAQVARPRDLRYRLVRHAIPRSYQTKREKALKDARQKTFGADAGTLVDFGDIDDQGQYNIKKIRVKVCGKYIYNYPSEKAMSRGGWLQFSVMAKDCALFDAVGLCRNWNEFFELSILATYQYFPSGNWASWVGDQMRQQVLQLGFIPYFQMELAEKYTMHHQTGSRSHLGRQHQIMESRNFICACLKRNDPVSRRFIQYIVMQANSMVALVRDVKDGKILAKPPDSELWLIREKSGMGRASRNEWNIIKEVGPSFFEDMDRQRQWHFNFKEYYDVIIWDLEPGFHFSHLYNAVQTSLIKAHRFQCGLDLYKPSEHILKTITRDKETQRTRDIKPGEEGKVQSIWDNINSDTNRVKFFTDDANSAEELSDDMPREWRYNEADRLEDEILFPWEHKTDRLKEHADGEDAGENEEELLATQGRMHEFENYGPDMKRFAYDLDTDEELDDSCDSLCASDCSGMHSDESHTEWYSDDYDSEFDDEEWEDEDESMDEEAKEAKRSEGFEKAQKMLMEPVKDPFAAVPDGTPPMRVLLEHLGLALPCAAWEEAERFEEAAEEYGFPGASNWDELWSNVRECRPTTCADYKELYAVVAEMKPENIKGNQEEALKNSKAMAKIKRESKKEKKLTKSQQKEQAVEAFRVDWEIHMDRERAACFKECWHRADLEPGARERWTEYTRLMTELEKWDSPNRGRRTTAHMLRRAKYAMQLLADLGLDTSSHRRIKRDMNLAWTLTSIFFGDAAPFFNSETGLSFKNSLLLNQEERAKHPPDVRSPHSNKTRPKEHWKEWDGVSKTKEGRRHVIDQYPEHWNLVVRPTIAHLYREGVICPSYVAIPKKLLLPDYPLLITAPNRYWPTGNGPAVCLTEPERAGKPDVYFDWRLSIQQINLPPTLQDPFSLAPLLTHARRFAWDSPDGAAAFTVLKIWSAPHFWPLMLGADNRDNTSFADGVGRMWEWKFIPKDMPYSEWSIHQSARIRVEPYRARFFGKSVVVRKDMLLVMARGREECKRLSTAAVWAVNTRPWRLEVDPWKSWFGVDLGFLEGLDEAWWV